MSCVFESPIGTSIAFSTAPTTIVNLHYVFSEGCEEIERLLRFRNHLREKRNLRSAWLYQKIKRALAPSRTWK